MPTYIVTYDLRGKRDYDSLYKSIKAFGTWAHILESVWAVVTNQTAAQVRDTLLSKMDSDDGLFVLKSGSEAAWKGVECKNDWLKEHL